MGAYLSEPVVEKETEEGGNGRIRFAATRMQGWRVHQEDSHNCICDYEHCASYFAVYDGHGGSDVSVYTAKYLPEHVKKMIAWKEGRYGQALEDAFLDFDKHLLSESALAELKELAGKSDDAANNSDEEQEDRRLLVEEAVLPLEELLQKYGLRIRKSASGTSAVHSRCRKVLSPNVSRKKTKSRIVNSDRDRVVDPVAKDHLNIEEEGIIQKLRATCGQEDGDKGQSECRGDSGAENSANGFLSPGGDCYVFQSECVEGESATEKGKLDIRRSLSEFSVAGAIGSAGDVSSPSTAHTNLTTQSMTSENIDGVERQRLVSPSRQRSSKSESELRILKMEDDSRGPVTNWRTMGHLGSGADAPGRSTETPETATAVSSSDDDSENNDNDFQMDQGASPDAEEDSDALESSSSVDKSVSEEEEEVEEDEEEGERGESMEEEGQGELDEAVMDMGGIELEPDDIEDADMFPVPSGDTPGVDSGTTACVALIMANKIYVANAGDSRCVLCRDGMAVDLSVDHKPEDEDEKSRIEKAGGKITMDGRVNGGLNLSRAIGDHFYKKNDTLSLREQMISAQPDIHVETLTPDDRFMVLACDGIWNSLSSQLVVDFVKERLDKEIPLSKICEEVIYECDLPTSPTDL